MKTLEALARSFAELHPEETARTLEAADPAEAARVLGTLPEKSVGGVIERLAPHALGPLLSRLDPDHVRGVLARIDTKQAVRILQHLDQQRREETLKGMPAEKGAKLGELLQYPPDTAAGMMDPVVTVIPLDVTAQETISILRKAPKGTLYYLYVTSRDGRLAGVLNMRDLLLASPRDRIEPLVRREVVTVSSTMDREEVMAVLRDRRFLALPVVDGEGRLLGVVKSNDVLQAAQEEAFEDAQKLVGAGAEEQALSPVSTVVQKRLGWLMVNLLTAFLAAAVVGLFEETIAKITALAILLPIVAGQGGNTGAQALAIVIRGLALREILPGSAWKLIRKEFFGGFINGVAVAVVTAGVVFLWDGRTALALVIGLAMVVNMALAAVAGAGIPLVLRALRRDPAQSSSIFMTTVTDVVGFASFLGFAVLFQSMLLAP